MMPRKGYCFQFKNYERKIKSPFTIYADFESVVAPENKKSKIQKCLIQTNIKKILLQLWI